MKTKYWIILTAILVGCIIAEAIGWNVSQNRSRERQTTIDFQRTTIDSLLALPPAHQQEIRLELNMAVTDKSKVDVNGKGNSGTINVPTERKYVVEIDSTSLNIIRKE